MNKSLLDTDIYSEIRRAVNLTVAVYAHAYRQGGWISRFREGPSMTMARVLLGDPALTRWHHCATRCVRRAFLLGEGPNDRSGLAD